MEKQKTLKHSYGDAGQNEVMGEPQTMSAARFVGILENTFPNVLYSQTHNPKTICGNRVEWTGQYYRC
jgi:hypothetical protein